MTAPDLKERLRRRAETMNGTLVGASDGHTYAVGYYAMSDRALDREAATHIESLEARIARLSEAGEAYWLRKNAVLVRELGNSMSPGTLAAAMERRADAIDAARALATDGGGR